MLDLRGKRVVVTGGGGFLGSFVVDRLKQRGCEQVMVPRRRDFDLTRAEGIEKMFAAFQPEVIFHLAAVVGGIGANKENPGSFFYQNAIMGIQLIEAARIHGVEKTIVAGSICSYPKFTPVPFKEEDLWSGYPEETNAPYGIAKKSLLVMCQAYRQQYGMNAIFLMPVNLYGPRDNFDLESSHVIPALIRKAIEARDSGVKELVCWGDGSPTREFLYVEDAAEGLISGAENYDGEQPVNVGSGFEVSIQDLTEKITRLSGFRGSLVWDTSRPNGQPRRMLDTTKAAAYFGFRAKVNLEEGLEKTIAWYEKNPVSVAAHQ
jgi:GDP-L-fucose synthase